MISLMRSVNSVRVSSTNLNSETRAKMISCKKTATSLKKNKPSSIRKITNCCKVGLQGKSIWRAIYSRVQPTRLWSSRAPWSWATLHLRKGKTNPMQLGGSRVKSNRKMQISNSLKMTMNLLSLLASINKTEIVKTLIVLTTKNKRLKS